jgi:hypothetical protein
MKFENMDYKISLYSLKGLYLHELSFDHTLAHIAFKFIIVYIMQHSGSFPNYYFCFDNCMLVYPKIFLY